MRIYTGIIREISWQASLGRTAWIECPQSAIPTAGRYVMAWPPEDADAPLATPLFMSCSEGRKFQTATPIPIAWEPGTPLQLRGPLGRGFTLPRELRRLALVSLNEHSACLRPLMQNALDQGAAVALFTDHTPPGLPAAVEVNPLETSSEALIWADYLALDLPSQAFSRLSQLLGVERTIHNLRCPAQALVHLAMPCGGLADCGACAVETRCGWKMACRDGPVFDLIDLLPKA